MAPEFSLQLGSQNDATVVRFASAIPLGVGRVGGSSESVGLGEAADAGAGSGESRPVAPHWLLRYCCAVPAPTTEMLVGSTLVP